MTDQQLFTTNGTQMKAERSQNALCRKILVIAKMTEYEKIIKDKSSPLFALIKENDPSVRKIQLAREEHVASLKAVCAALRKCNACYQLIRRNQLEDRLKVKNFDLIITVGGDGTIIDTSHFAGSIPILGVNSSTSTSHGHFCLTDGNGVGSVIAGILAGNISPSRLTTLSVMVDGNPLKERVFNEILICDREIGEASRYSVEIDGVKEDQRSDGFFVGTPAGSTGWMHSYGAETLPILDETIQFLVRGLIRTPKSKFDFAQGKLPPAKTLSIYSRMKNGVVLLDGQHIKYPLDWNSKITIERSHVPLMLFVEPKANDSWMENSMAIASR